MQPNVICNSLTSRSVMVRTKGADTAADHLASDRKMLLLSLPIPGPVRKHRNIVRVCRCAVGTSNAGLGLERNAMSRVVDTRC